MARQSGIESFQATPARSRLRIVFVVATLAFAAVANALASPQGLAIGREATTATSVFFALESLLVLVVCGGRDPRGVLIDLVGGSWRRPRDVAFDVLLAGVAWVVSIATVVVLVVAFLPAQPLSGRGPVAPTSTSLWIAASVLAAFSEEVVFRGYLQRELGAAARSEAAGVIGQAILFGAWHVSQGLLTATKLTLFGLILGALASHRRSLRPGMILHAWVKRRRAAVRALSPQVRPNGNAFCCGAR